MNFRYPNVVRLGERVELVEMCVKLILTLKDIKIYNIITK